MAKPASNIHMYRFIYNELVDKIVRGEYPPGSRLPSEKELAESYGVSRITSRKSLGMLAEEGLAERLPGKGTFVRHAGKAVPGPGTAGTGTDKGPIIGLVMAGFADSFGVDILNGVLDRGEELGFSVLLARSHDRTDREEKAVQRMLDRGVDGLIVDPAHGEFYSNIFLSLVSSNFPLVFVDRHLEGLKAPYVGTDNVEAARKLTDYLFSLGHETLGFVSFNPRGTSAIEERLEGFMKAHNECGMSPSPSHLETGLISNICAGEEEKRASIERDLGRVRDFLARSGTMTAVVADELEAACLVKRAAGDLNLSIPGDLSLVTFDRPGYSIDLPFITHMKQKEYAMGRRAVEILGGRMEGKGDMVREFLEAELVLGDSTGNNVKKR